MEQKRPRGRPTKYDDATARAICARVACGVTPHHAGQLEGVPPATLRDWLDRHEDFALAIERAKSDHLAENLRRINTAAENGSWKAAVWLAEHADPHYRPVPQRLEVDGTINLNVSVDQLSDDELAALAAGQPVRALEAQGAGRAGAETPAEDQALAS